MRTRRGLSERSRDGAAARTRVTVGLGAVLAAVAVLVVAVAVGAGPMITLGAGDPGVVVRWGYPLLRLAADAAATVCVGALVFAVAFTLPGADGALSPRAYAAVLSAGRWALAWAVAAAAETAVSLALISGGTVGIAGGGPIPGGGSFAQLAALLAAGEEPLAWVLTAVLAAVVAVLCRLVLRRTSAAGVLVLAGVALLPPLATGHASSQAGHDVALPALWVHVPAAVVWLGALVALMRPGWRHGAGASPPGAAEARYARLAGWCWLLVVAPGLVVALVLVPPDALLSSGYGRLLLVVVAVSVLLGELARRGRRWVSAPDRAGDPRRRTFLAGEFLLLAVTFGLSAASTVVVPPSWQRPVTADQTLLGYDLAGPPSFARLALDWRVDVVLAPVAVVAAVLYVLAVRRVAARGERWPVGRTAAWLAGCVVLLVATSSGIGRYAPAMFSAHIASHMLVSMLVPVLWALGGPLTLLRRTVAPRGRGELPGLRDAVDALGSSVLGRTATRPLVVLVAFVVAPFALYVTGLFDAAVRFRWAELLIDVVFLAVGLLFAQLTVGIDAVGARWPTWARLAMLLAAMPFDAVFAALLTNTTTVVGNGSAGSNMYSSLALPWTAGDLPADQRVAAALALGVGEVALLVAIAALLWRWDRRQRRETRTTGPDGGVDGAGGAQAVRDAVLSGGS